MREINGLLYEDRLASFANYPQEYIETIKVLHNQHNTNEEITETLRIAYPNLLPPTPHILRTIFERLFGKSITSTGNTAKRKLTFWLDQEVVDFLVTLRSKNRQSDFVNTALSIFIRQLNYKRDKDKRSVEERMEEIRNINEQFRRTHEIPTTEKADE